MRINNYGVKANTYAQHKKDEGTIMIAYREFGALFDKYVTSGSNKAIDFGSGTGRSRKYLEEVGFDADGVDIDPDMIEKAKELDKKNEDKYQLITDSTIPQRKSKYDLAFSSLVVLELCNREEIIKYFSEAYRVLKFDGTLIVLTVTDDFYKHPWYSVDTNYPGNREAKSGDIVKVKIKEINLELEDFYWTKEDYRTSAMDCGFTIVEQIEPKGYETDGVEWTTEKDIAPFVIFVMKKTKSLENIFEIAKRNSLEIDLPGKGFFSEIYRDNNIIKKDNLPANYSGDRNASATIRLLMTSNNRWPFHRLKSEEVFNHIEGNDVLIHCIDFYGNYTKIYLGEEHDDAVKMYKVPENCWYAQEICGKNGYSLIEATTKPGFHPDDQIEAKKEELLAFINGTNKELIDLINKFIPFEKKYKNSNSLLAKDSPLLTYKENSIIVESKVKFVVENHHWGVDRPTNLSKL